jgi:hypothetical protein
VYGSCTSGFADATPSVVTASACVSPRVNSAEPWVRGRTPPARLVIGRTSVMDLQGAGITASSSIGIEAGRSSVNVVLSRLTSSDCACEMVAAPAICSQVLVNHQQSHDARLQALDCDTQHPQHEQRIL